MSYLEENGAPPKDDQEKRLKKQGDAEHAMVEKIRTSFENFRTIRNQPMPRFGLNHDGTTRTLLDVIDYCNNLVDGYKNKAAYKEEWQANISDITLHSKLMAVAANMVGQKYTVEYKPRFSADYESQFKSAIMDDVAHYIYTQERNGHMDQLFSVLKSLREPVCIKYVGYQNTEFIKGVDIQFVKTEEFYPERINTFFMNEIKRCVWRRVYTYWNWKSARSGPGWVDIDKVKDAGKVRADDSSFFDVSSDLYDYQVEELMWFDEEENQFLISANNILITPIDTKLSMVSPSDKLPFTKTGFEPLDPGFFYYRPLALTMGPTQEAIDYLFNAMFDKQLLDVMRPILVGGINDMVDDYISPASFVEVADVKQIRELDVRPIDLTAFRVLKELQDRNTFASVDAVSQGKVSMSSPTATEVERVQEAAQRMFAMFNMQITDGLTQEYRLLGDIIVGKYFTNKDFKQFYIENSKLTNGKIGTKVVRFKSFNKLPARDQFGVSPQLQDEADKGYGPDTQIIEVDRNGFKDWEYKVESAVAPIVDSNKYLKKSLLNQKLIQMYQLPQLYPPKIVKKIDVENNRDILGQYASELLGSEEEVPQEDGLPGALSAGQTSNQLSPQFQKATPDLSKLMSADAG